MSLLTSRRIALLGLNMLGEASMLNRHYSCWRRWLKLLLISLLLGGSAGAYAIDTYDPATNQLTIPLVIVGNTTYTNVRITVGNVISVGGGAAANTYDTYSSATNQLTIPAVLSGATTFTNVVITVGSVISVGGSTPTFTLSSADVPSGSTFGSQYILNGFGCTGGNISPALSWSNPPVGTVSYALQVYDPDAPTGSGFWHWAVYDIPVAVTGLARGAGNAPGTLPAGARGGNTDFMNTGATDIGSYGGPCPPVGDAPHRYIFTLFALGVANLATTAQIPPTGTAGVHGFALSRGGIGALMLGKASFTAHYGR